MSEEIQTIIIDNGSNMIKAGFGGDDDPKCIIPSFVGKPKYKHGFNQKDLYVGQEVMEKTGVLIVEYLIKNGIITDWEKMEKVWNFVFEELKINPSEHPVLLTEAPSVSKANREKMIQMMFETFNVPSFYAGAQADLSVIASGNLTGICVDIGDNEKQIVPVYEGHYIPKFSYTDQIAGNSITKYFLKLLEENGVNVPSFNIEIIREIKEKLSFVAPNLDEELQMSKDKEPISYSLPDGSDISITNEHFRCNEILFNPSLIDSSFGGINDKINDVLLDIDRDLRNAFASNIVVSGGVSITNGFIERFENEFKKHPRRNVKITALPDRKYQVWKGGSILSFTSAFKDMLVSRKEYNEAGAQIVIRKCL